MDSRTVFKKLVNLVTLSSFLVWSLASATPEGGTVVQGNASISNPTSSQTVVNQTSQNTVINWQSFNTASNESVRFNQPNASSIALNRITNGAPTNFAGSLSANGQVWILNPAGVLFTNTAKIDVGGLLATTHNITDSNFMTGNYKFDLVPGYEAARVINNGSITAADAGIVALVAPHVENNGYIQANLGKVSLSSGKTYVLDMYGDQLINFGNNEPIKHGSVSNAGKIVADGGKVYMTANYAGNVLNNTINMSGTVQARSVGVNAKGEIVLYGGDFQAQQVTGTTRVTGKLIASNIKSGNNGGKIETSGETVIIDPSAVIDAGKSGLWYLDPLTISISTYGTVVQDQLQAGTNVTLSTGYNLSIPGTGDINVDVPITWNSSATLLLGAYNNINISQPITSTNGSLILRSDMGNSGLSTVGVNFSGAGNLAFTGLGQIRLYYNPTSYATPTNFSPNLVGTTATFTGFMMINNLTDLFNAGVVGSPTTQYNYSLNSDIDYLAIPIFSIFNGNSSVYIGSFDGHDYATGLDHSIINVNSTPAALFYGGSFAAQNYGTIENVTIQGASNPTFAAIVGGIVGHNGGTISNVTYQGTMIHLNPSEQMGGIAGSNAGLLSHVTFDGILANGGANIIMGGIAGLSTGTIEYAYTTPASFVQLPNPTPTGATGGLVGSLIGGTITNSTNAATVFGSGSSGTALGGIAGNIAGVVTLQNVVNEGVMFSPTLVANPIIGAAAPFSIILGGGVYYNADNCFLCTFPIPFTAVPLNSAQMNVQANFVGFDFTNVWTTNGNTTPPQLIPVSLPAIDTVLGTGTLSIPSSQTVSLYADNVLAHTTTSSGSGLYLFNYDPNLNPSIFMVTTAGVVNGTSLETFSPTTNTPLVNFDITDNTVTANSPTGITFSNTILAAQTNALFYAASGADVTLNPGISLVVTSGTPYSIDGDITATSGGGMTFGGAVTVATDATLSADNNIDFQNTVNGASNLILTLSSGSAIFENNVGGIIPLASLTVNGATDFNGATSVQTSGNQNYLGPVILQQSLNPGLSAGGNVLFGSTIDGTYDLFINAGGTVEFGGLVGSVSALGNLDVIGLQINVNTSGISTSGNQTYHSPVVLLTDVNSPGFQAGGIITFESTLNGNGGGPWSLIAGASEVHFKDVIGGVDPLNALTINADIINFDANATSITTVGTQSYTGATAMTVGADPVFTASNFVVNIPVVLLLDTTFTSTVSDIDFQSTVDGPANLILNPLGQAIFQGDIGAVTPLASLLVYGLSSINGATLIQTNGDQIYSDTVTLNNSVTMKTLVDGDIQYNGGGVVDAGLNTLTASSANAAVGRTGQGITGSVSVGSLILSGPGGANLSQYYPSSESFVGGVGGKQARANTSAPSNVFGIVIYCVNGFGCEPPEVAQYQIFNFVSGLGNCDASGCDNLEIIILDESAFVTCLFGFAEAVDTNGKSRVLFPGAIIYSGEKVLVSGGSTACVKYTYSNETSCISATKSF